MTTQRSSSAPGPKRPASGGRRPRGHAVAAAVAGALALTALSAGTAQAADTDIAPGSKICKNQAWTSGNGRTQLKVLGSGELTVTQSGTVVWRAPGTKDKGHCAVYQQDGNVVVHNSAGAPVWASGVHGGINGYGWLSVQDDGNVVVYGYYGNPVWATGTHG
ncbi:hypothetical protein ABT354_00705 [Streptomyces sp. NPDC000594]|uniref:hypothetical protein n=1 Tax=Streptomyces sp. NPDC000594 TaxID=3154261 RepID=UPI00331AF545